MTILPYLEKTATSARKILHKFPGCSNCCGAEEPSPNERVLDNDTDIQFSGKHLKYLPIPAQKRISITDADTACGDNGSMTLTLFSRSSNANSETSSKCSSNHETPRSSALEKDKLKCYQSERDWIEKGRRFIRNPAKYNTVSVENALRPQDSGRLASYFGYKQEKFAKMSEEQWIDLFGKPTDLVELKNYNSTASIVNEKATKVKQIFVKNESQRLGLNAFKAAGVSFAIFELIESHGGIEQFNRKFTPNKPYFYEKDPQQIQITKPVLATMTDGNHGRAVGAIAQKFGLNSVIFVPEIMTEARRQAIINTGAIIVVVEGSYDDAIKTVVEEAEKYNWHMILDTYDEDCFNVNYSPAAPLDIVAGYGGALFGEARKQYLVQLRNNFGTIKITSKSQQINRLVLQAGVGSFSSGGLMYVNYEREQARKNNELSIFADDLKIIIVEPTDATCLMENVESYVQNNNTNFDANMIRLSNDSKSLSPVSCARSPASKDSDKVKQIKFMKKMSEDPTFLSKHVAEKVGQALFHDPESGIPDLHPCSGKTESIMAGLNCGVPSATAFPVIRDLTDVFVAVGNKFAKEASRIMALDGIISGESGSVGLAAMLAFPELFDENSIVMLVNTEGNTDPELYDRILKREI